MLTASPATAARLLRRRPGVYRPPSSSVVGLRAGGPPSAKGGPGSGNYEHKSAEPSELGKYLASLPVDVKAIGKQKKELLQKYKSDPEFKDFADAATRFTSGYFGPMQNAVQADLTGQTEAWMDAEKQARGGKWYGPEGGLVGLGMGKITALDGSDLAEGVITVQSALKDGQALMGAIRGSPEIEGDVWRGINGSPRFDTYEQYAKTWNWLPKDQLMSKVRYDMLGMGRQIETLKPGDEYNMPAPVSFTHSQETATKFSLGKASGQGPGGGTQSSILIRIVGAKKGVNMGAFSKWKQQEFVTQGRFEVVSMEKTPGSSWRSSASYLLTLKQTGVY
jgi:hypothetical protein